MSTHPKFPTGLAILLLLTGCAEGLTEPGADDELRLIQTDDSEYVAEPVETSGSIQYYEFVIVAEFTNDTEQTIHLLRCSSDSAVPQFGVEVVEPSGDTPAAYDELPSCADHSEHFVVEPGETRSDELRLRGPQLLSGFDPEPVGIFEGSFRLKYWDRGCQGPDHCEPGASQPVYDTPIRSNTFEVTLAD